MISCDEVRSYAFFLSAALLCDARVMVMVVRVEVEEPSKADNGKERAE